MNRKYLLLKTDRENSTTVNKKTELLVRLETVHTCEHVSERLFSLCVCRQAHSPRAETCPCSRQGNIKITLPQFRNQCRHETISRHMGKNTCFMQKWYRMILAQNKPRSMQRYKKKLS